MGSSYWNHLRVDLTIFENSGYLLAYEDVNGMQETWCLGPLQPRPSILMVYRSLTFLFHIRGLGA